MIQLARMVFDVFRCLPTDVLTSICLWIRPKPTSPKRLSLLKNHVLITRSTGVDRTAIWIKGNLGKYTKGGSTRDREKCGRRRPVTLPFMASAWSTHTRLNTRFITPVWTIENTALKWRSTSRHTHVAQYHGFINDAFTIRAEYAVRKVELKIKEIKLESVNGRYHLETKACLAGRNGMH
jgi:hypothetical protein